MFVQVHSLIRIIFLVIFFKTPVYSWGFSFQDTQRYLKIADQQNISDHPQWLKLGHYKKTNSGYQSLFTEGLIISERGAISPVEELRATINLLFSDAKDYIEKNNEHPQCYYLARTQWLS